MILFLFICSKALGLVHVFPDAGRQPYLTFIKGATRTLDMMIYVLDDKEITEAVLAAHKRGVKVRILIEKNKFSHDASSSSSETSLARLKKQGVEIRMTPKTVTQTHVKMMIRDERDLLLSTGNLDSESFEGLPGGDAATRDFALEDSEDMLVQEGLQVFSCDWRSDGGCEYAKKKLVISPLGYREGILQAISEAQVSIDLYQQDLTDPGIQKALLEVVEKGVQLRVIMTPFPFGGKEDKNKPFQEMIREKGGQVKGVLNPYIHTKILILDGKKVFLGTSNFFTASLNKNRELGTFLEKTEDRERVVSVFNQDWAR